MLRTLHGHVKLISDFISYVFEWMTGKRGLIIYNIWERKIAMDDAYDDGREAFSMDGRKVMGRWFLSCSFT